MATTTTSEPKETECAVTPNEQMSTMILDDLISPSAPRAKSVEKPDLMSQRSSVDSILKNTRESNDVFFTDLKGADKPVYKGRTPPTIQRSLSQTSSDSSEEIVLFAGRRPVCNKDGQKHASSARSSKLNGGSTKGISTPAVYRSFTATVVDDPMVVQTARNRSSTKQGAPNCSSRDLKRFHINGDKGGTADRLGRRRRDGRQWKESNYQEILDDYVANIREENDFESLFVSQMLNERDPSDSETPEWEDEAESLTKQQLQGDPSTKVGEWDSTDLEDFNQLSTSDEAPDCLEQVLSKRERPSGVQYLVVGSGNTVDDARWLPINSLGTPSGQSLIQEFENKAEWNRLLKRSDVCESVISTDEQGAQDLEDDLDKQVHIKDLEDKWKAGITDEQIAKLLSKQEELGMGSRSLMLFDGDNFETEIGEELRLDRLRKRTHRASSWSRGKNRSQSKLSSATSFADALDQDSYNGFNVIDQQRSNLRKRPKEWRGKPSMELSDSELEQSIQLAWEKDRTRKRMRKQEREELRAQGLLGNKNKIDVKAKYSEGISMIDVKKKIKDFLISSLESLAFPPMAHDQRKMVHEIASAFKLKSKSIGGGNSRLPVLYKTSRTIQYNEKTTKAVDSVLASGRFLPRLDRAKIKNARTGSSRRGGAASAGVSYRDGEVVGAAAPEIGQENRGRTMLERMGWSTGTALGALNNNRGLVQPVTQVVKTSRSGLG